ncbi:MAG: AMP-binding protein [Chitinivibrionia bacterium]|nr:AMP-binding protein [Chitinivibrionia bacterium]
MQFLPEYSWERLSEDEINHKTLLSMKKHISELKENSAHYKRKLANISPQDIKTMDNILSLPFTSKDELSSQTSDFYCSNKIAETVVTSGSTGNPLVVPLTSTDLARLAFNEQMSFASIGINAQDKAQIMVSLDRLFVAGMAYYRGLIALGVNTARIGVLPFEMQEYYIKLLQPSVLVGVPSYFIKLAENLKNCGKNICDSSVKKIVCIGEPLRNENMSLNDVALKIERLWGAKIYSTYASTEICSSYCDCECRTGGHSHPELIYTEILDDEGKPVADGEIGEIVVSTFGMQGMPVLRYRTGDMSFKVAGNCPCGRNSMRIGPVIYRKSQLIKYKGTTFYPSTITNVVDSLGCCEDYIVELKGQKSDDDSIDVVLHAVTDEKNLDAIEQAVLAAARVRVSVNICDKNKISMLRGDARKAIKFVNNRR